MRRILVSCAVLAVLTMLTLPAAATARAPVGARPGYLVVSKAVGNGGAITGDPVVTLVIRGFVLGQVSGSASVTIIQLGNGGASQVNGPDYTKTRVPYRRGISGTRYTGSNFRFRVNPTGGPYPYLVVVRGSGVYLFAGGHGHVTLRGSSYQRKHGRYVVDGGRWRPLPTKAVKRRIG